MLHQSCWGDLQTVTDWHERVRLRVLRNLTRITWAETRDLLRAQNALLEAQFRLWTSRTGSLLSVTEEVSSLALTPAQVWRAQAVAWSVTRAARYGLFRPKCLARSIALTRLLKRNGITGGRLRIGVRPQPGAIMAHAWVTLGGQVLGDDPVFVDGFTEISDPRLAGLA